MLPETINSPADSPQPVFRKAQPQDGARMHALVKEMGGLELNTAYFYVLYCMDFADTCAVAEVDGKLADFVLGDRKSTRLNTSHVAISYDDYCINKTRLKRYSKYSSL